ncbi:MAG: hypothetical protein JSR28_14350 [Proteobacteria bacterium]|nr:hypothetical protein [Pseudomonadota bacterium]
MAKRQWKNLDPGTTYILTAGDGWGFSMNGDGTVSLAFSGTGVQANAVDLSVSPDPGGGDKYPPTEP